LGFGALDLMLLLRSKSFMSLVLYRKYRPQTFGEVVGQEHIIQTLTNAIASGMLSHAYLFAGPRGSGKTTVARLLAKAVNCQNRKDGEAEPCNKCSSCTEIMEGRSMDLIEIDAASNRGIEEIRDLRDGIKFAPTKSRYKVFIIDEAHQLTKEAANALLKTLEEPPSHAIFILATTEIHKMMPTIISRCQRHDFRKLTQSEIVGRLEAISSKEGARIEKSVFELIASNSEGALRDAESLLDQVLCFRGGDSGKEIKLEEVRDLLGIVDTNLVSQLVDFISQKKASEAIDFLNKTLEKSTDPKEFAKSLIRYLRQALLLKINPDLNNSIITGLTYEEQEKLLSQVKKFQEQELHHLIQVFLDAENKMRYSSIPQLPLELAIVEVLVEK